MNTVSEFNPEEAQMLRDMIDRFCAAEVAPFYEQWERDEIMPRDIWLKLGEAGFLCVDIPEAYGGPGSNFEMSMVLNREMARAGYASLGGGMGVHSDIVAHYILNNGSEAQKQHYLPKMVVGECVGAVAMTEPGAGSDLQGVRTTARRDGDDWIINGSKTFITNGQHCDVVVTVARTEPDAPGSRGLSLFLVDTDKAGFSRGRNLEKLGMHAADTSELFYEEVRIPGDALLGELNKGFIALMTELPRERLTLAVGAVAAMEGALAMTVDYVNERQAFGAPLSKLQNTRFRMAEMQTEYRLNNAFVNECIDKYNAGELDASTASMAKFAATEAQCRVVDGCLQMFGGYGYMKEYPISRAYADARIQRIYGGTSEIMREVIARSVLDN
ncbi:MAG: acyl-CoA dehydrogenase family protein [Gammaproteobacteria bacterium]|nr:acyl-CoA dehydrogenase family protein [Gammaproteobacteria bacterium]